MGGYVVKNYIQIGSNVGKDTFYNRVLDLHEKSRIFLIEPNSELIPELKKNYSKINLHEIVILNVGIVHDKNINRLFLYTDSGHSSVINRKSHPFVSGTKNFFPMTFEELCEKFSIREIENLYIDTEGYDYSIIDSINLNEYDIKKIECEEWPYDIDSSGDLITGPRYFEEYIKPKLLNHHYDYSTDTHDGMKTHVFLKKREN